MSKIGVVGMGKLGLPVALAIESRGHEVMGYDVSYAPYECMKNRQIPYQEENLEPLLNATRIKMTHNLGKLVVNSDIVFVAVQTPHQPQYEGTTRLPEDRADFDYTHLIEAISAVVKEKPKTVAVISTCLPGTFDREIKPIIGDTEYVYTPQFIAMGTVLQDYLHPEFNLIGVDSPEAANTLEAFYRTINTAPALKTDITTAEGIKVSYNTWITAKTVIANLWGEMSEKLGMNFEDIFKAWSLADRRLISTSYMKAGMSDGGGCHPRDNIALSHIAKKIGLSHNIFDDLMKAREDYEDYHARQAIQVSKETGLHLIILGRSFKPETNIETGSAAILMANLAQDYGYPFSHVQDMEEYPKAVYFIATNHKRYKDIDFPEGSVVINPFLV